MKNILLFCFILLLISCEDILKEEPKAIVQETFYNTADEAETALNAIYSVIKVYVTTQV